MKTLKDLLEKATDKDILNALIKNYPDQEKFKDAYEEFLKVLRDKEPVENPDGMIIKVVKYELRPWDDPEDISDNNYEVYGTKKTPSKEDLEDQFFNNRWGLDFSKKAEWLSYFVDDEDLKILTVEDYLSHCLWEMTFCGFSDDDIQAEMDELKRRIDEIESGKAKFIPWEEVKKQLFNDLIDED